MFLLSNVYKVVLFLCVMKKIGVYVLLLLFALSFVSAQGVFEGLKGTAESFYDNILAPFGKFLLGANTTDGDLFFGKLMIFIILLSITWLVVDKFPLMTGKRKTGFVVALAISVLSVRYLSQVWIDTVILPYSVLGVAMTSLIPFVIYFFFVKDLPTRSMRKIAWIFAFVVFTGMFLYRVDTFNVVSSTSYFVSDPVPTTVPSTVPSVGSL